MNMKGEKTDWNYLVQRECARVEWKENVANPQNVVKILSAFANDLQQVGGGRVLCGLKEEKNENGEPVAIPVGLDEKRFKEVKNKVMDYCHRYVEPPITPEVSEYPTVKDPARRILVFAITSSQYAHRYRTKKEDVNYYIRINDETRAANGLIPQLLERKKVWPPYMEQTLPEANLDDIDLLALKKFLGRLELPHPVEKYLEANIPFRGDVKELVTYPPGRTDLAVPRNFTLLLFGKEPHRYFGGAYAILSVYKGKNKDADQSQRFEAYGPVPELLRNIMARLQLYMGLDIDKSENGFAGGNPNRLRFSEYAVQEAIVNAFVHRDYRSYDPVRITLFKDRIEVTSPGGAYAPINPEDIRKGEIFTSWRNPSLAWFMVALKFAQNEGQGIRAIIRLTKKISGREPRFNITSHFFQVVIPAFNPMLDSFRQEIKTEDKTEANSLPEPVKKRISPQGENKSKTREFDISIELAAVRENVDQVKDFFIEMSPELSRKLVEIGDSWDAIHPDSDPGEYIAPMAKLGRFLKKCADEKSDYNKLIKNSPKSMEVVGELCEAYNKFAQWLALPQITEPFTGKLEA